MDTPDQKPKKKKSGLGWKSTLFIITSFIGIFFFTPAPEYMLSLVPKNYYYDIFSPLYREITLRAKPETIEEPQKLNYAAPLPVLSRETGICFSFQVTLDDAEAVNVITRKQLQSAQRGDEIAEIIVIGDDKKEYTLKEVTLSTGINPDILPRPISVICQKFGNTYSLTPEKVTAIYIRPLEPFTPLNIIWATARTME